MCTRVPPLTDLSMLQLGTLGAGNHYAEIQVVEEIYDSLAAARMGIEEKGQVSTIKQTDMIAIVISVLHSDLAMQLLHVHV